jgi:hypothetical protein
VKLEDILLITDQSIKPEDCKVHLACSDGDNDPYDLFKATEEKFDEWQALQSKRNFSKPYLATVIAIPDSDDWVFAGLFKVGEPIETKVHPRYRFTYQMERVQSFDAYVGRVIVCYERSFRQCYPFFESLEGQLEVVEMKRNPIA